MSVRDYLCGYFYNVHLKKKNKYRINVVWENARFTDMFLGRFINIKCDRQKIIKITKTD